MSAFLNGLRIRSAAPIDDTISHACGPPSVVQFIVSGKSNSTSVLAVPPYFNSGSAFAQAFMAEQREDVTPEECKQRYDEYKADYTQRLTHSFIDVHRKEVCYPSMLLSSREGKY